MTHPSRLYILADGAHARLVRRTEAPHRFETMETLDHSAALAETRARIKAHPAGRSHESAGPSGYPVGRNGEVRREKAEFMAEVADRAVQLAATERTTEAVIAAPSRLAPVLRAAIGRRLTVSAELHRDLIKIADLDLDAWLSPTSLRHA